MVLNDESHFLLNIGLDHSICHPQLTGHQELGVWFKNRRTLATAGHLGSDCFCKICREPRGLNQTDSGRRSGYYLFDCGGSSRKISSGGCIRDAVTRLTSPNLSLQQLFSLTVRLYS